MEMRFFMEKETIRRPVIGTALLVLLLILFYHQDPFSKSDSWKEKFWSRRSNLPSDVPESLKLQLRRLVRDSDTEFETTGFSCSHDDHTEECVISKPVVLDKQSLTIYLPSNDQNHTTKRTIKPYPRREDKNAMERVSPVQILQGNLSSIKPPACQYTHDIPAIIFSFGGFSENTFHDFNEIIIPLFITSRHFESRVQFVITDYRARWVRKFHRVLKGLSQFDVVDADSDETVHCFPAAVVGLRYHDNLAVNSTELPRGQTVANFRQFLRDSYNLQVNTILKPKKPKLLLLSRQQSRKFLNEDEMVKMMEKLGFQVQRAFSDEMSKMDQFAHVVNSCDLMVGVHGAGLTNEVFLPNGAVVVQIVPLGLEWASTYYFARSAVNMGLRYVEYKVEANETSLYDLYGPNDPVILDPATIWAKGYRAVKDIYIDNQDFRINLARFKGALLEALKLLG